MSRCRPSSNGQLPSIGLTMKFNKLIKTDQMVAFVLFLAIGVFGYLLPVIGYFSSVPGALVLLSV